MDDHKEAASRRAFLKMAATGAPVLGLAAATGEAAAATAEEPVTSGLRDTELTRKYYASARF